MTKRDVFISYNSEQFEAAGWVRSVLETNGISCWMAPADIPGGSSYAAEIPVAIANCRVFVVVLTEKAQQSKWVPKELDLAVNSGKVIMPFMLEQFQLRDDFNFYLSNVQRYTAYENKVKAMEKMVREIQAVLGVNTQNEPVKEVPYQQKEKKQTGGKKIIAACCAGLLVVAAALLLILRPWETKKPEPDGQGTVIAADTQEQEKQDTADAADTQETDKKEEAAEADTQETETAEKATEETQAEEQPETAANYTENLYYHISLYPSENVSVKNYSAAKKLLRERLNVFTDGQVYQWTENEEDSIDLLLPKSAFAGYDTTKVLQCYLTRAIKLYLLDIKHSKTFLPLERSDLESVTLETGTIPDVDASEYGVPDEPYQYIVITLTDEFVQNHRAEYDTWEQPVFAQDVEAMASKGYFYHYTFPSGDGKKFYVLNNDLGGKFSELAVFNLQHDSLSEAFYFNVDSNALADWEDPRTAMVKGANQCATEDFTAETVTFILKFSSDISAGKLLDAEIAVKKRLDTLETPYAFGLIGEGEKGRKFVIKTTLEHMGLPVMNMLGCSYLDNIYTRSMYASASGLHMNAVKGQENAYTVSTEYSFYEDDWKRFAQEAAKRGEKEAYLWLADQPVIALGLDETAETAVMKFNGLCEMRNGKVRTIPVNERNVWKANLVRQIMDTTGTLSYLYMDSYQMNPAPDGTIPTAADFGVQDAADISGIRKTISGISENAVVNYGDGAIKIFLNLPADDSLPDNAMKIPEQILDALDPLTMDIKTINIYLIDENNDENERARVFFAKQCGSAKTDDNGEKIFSDAYIYAYGIFRGGRVAPYAEEIRKRIESSEFYQSRKSEYGYWTFE